MPFRYWIYGLIIFIVLCILINIIFMFPVLQMIFMIVSCLVMIVGLAALLGSIVWIIVGG